LNKDKLLNKPVWLSVVTSVLFSTSQVQEKDVTVEIYKEQFLPSETVIEVGDRVIWKNIEKRQYHNV